MPRSSKWSPIFRLSHQNLECIFKHSHVGNNHGAIFEVFTAIKIEIVVFCVTATCGGWISTFRKTVLPPSSGLKHGPPKRWYTITTQHSSTTQKTTISQIAVFVYCVQTEKHFAWYFDNTRKP